MTLPRLPDGDYLLRDALIPAAVAQGLPGAPCLDVLRQGLVHADIAVRKGRFTRAEPGCDLPQVALNGRILLPRFVDLHVHVDKAYTVGRTGFSSDGLGAAVQLSMGDLPNRTPEDLRARMERSLRNAESMGTRALRTHLDTWDNPETSASWAAWADVSARWQDRLHLQAVALTALFRVEDPAFERRAAAVAERGAILGAFVDTGTATPERLDRLLGIAAQHGLDLDLHVDESIDPNANGLRELAEAVLRNDFPGRVVAGHCCALAQMPEAERDALIALVARTGIEVVSLPATNAFLQDRQPGHGGRLRGLAPVQELAAAGVPVSFATDNVRDAFYPYGSYDLLEAQRSGVMLAQLEADAGDWIAATTATPAAAMGLSETGRLVAGGAADGVLFDARDWADLFSGTTLPRQVLKAGQPLVQTPPSHAPNHAPVPQSETA